MALMPGWSVKFCSPDTKEDRVKIEIGKGGDDSSRRFWRNANPQVAADQWISLPDDLRTHEEIWIKISALNEKEVHACIKFDDNNTQKMTFNEEEEHEISKDDRDDCGC